MKKYKVGIVPGSFDPITLGHVNIIERAAELCDKVFVAVMINSDKEYMFELSERERIARAALASFDNVFVISSSGMLYELCAELCADVIVKGVRNDVDRAYEEKMAAFNKEHYPEAETLLLDADPALIKMSSTFVRELIRNGEPFCDAMPKGAAFEIEKIINNAF